jgi:hypothetical protein
MALRVAWFSSLALVATLAAVATIGLAGPGETPPAAPAKQDPAQPIASGDPVAFVKRVVDAVVADDYRRAWRTLHPAHQRVAPLEDYVRCEWREPIPGRLQSIAVLGVRDRPLAVSGLEGTVPSTAVSLRLTIEDLATGERTAVTSTFHAVAVAGRWRWVLPNARYALYRTGECGRSAGGAV